MYDVNAPLDHELHRTPVTKAMKDEVIAAARRRRISIAMWQREALQEKLDREQGK